jgi:hypothetical protein
MAPRKRTSQSVPSAPVDTSRDHALLPKRAPSSTSNGGPGTSPSSAPKRARGNAPVGLLAEIAARVLAEAPGASVCDHGAFVEFSAYVSLYLNGRSSRVRVRVFAPDADSRVTVSHLGAHQVRVAASELETIVAVASAPLHSFPSRAPPMAPARLLRIPYPRLKLMAEAIAFVVGAGRIRGVRAECTGRHALGAELTRQSLALHALGPCCSQDAESVLVCPQATGPVTAIAHAYAVGSK